LPSLLSDLLNAVSSLLSQTKPDLGSIETADQFAELIGFKCHDVTEILAENSIFTHNRRFELWLKMIYSIFGQRIFFLNKRLFSAKKRQRKMIFSAKNVNEK